MTDQSDYSDHPVSLTEARAVRNQNFKDWTVRDMLIHTLRQIDRGDLDADAAVLTIRCREPDGGRSTFYIGASDDMMVLLGLLSRAAHIVNEA